MLVIPGAPNAAEVMPFWRAVLEYEPAATPPTRIWSIRGPSLWFEPMDEPRPDGAGAIHVAVWVQYEQAEVRVAAALAAGGWMVREEFAPLSWTLADATGNEADVATTKGSD